MEKLIPLINEIHDILYQTNLSNELELPQIIVVGSQSVGKSSVLESILGKDFLPRGKGIVTRRPIEIQLINLKSDEKQEWVEFLDRKGEKFTDFDQVSKEIDILTEKVAGKEKAISNLPIKLKFYSKNVVDLLITDLPGLTKNPVGNQPKNIEQLIRDIVMSYARNKNVLILAVSKATDDLANSESLKIAREVDPEGLRTIGVLTQLDLLDESTDCLKDLQNKTYPLKLGYVGVVCRSQRDIEMKKSFQDQLEDERKFFQNHKTYHSYIDRMGVPYLIKTLNVNFIEHIKRCLPQIKENLQGVISEKEHELKQYGDYEKIEDLNGKGLKILTLISKFTHAFQELIKGKYIKFINEELTGGARISHIMNEIFRKTINQIDPFEIVTDEDIRTAIKNANGLKPSLFVPTLAFENLVRQQILRLKDPSLECCQLIHDELRRILNIINISEIELFEFFKNQLNSVMESVLIKCRGPTDEMIKNLIEIEMGFINTNHPDFQGDSNILSEINTDNDQLEEEEKSQKNKKASNTDLKMEQKEPEKSMFSGLIPGFFKSNKQQADIVDNKLIGLQGKKKETNNVDMDYFSTNSSSYGNQYDMMYNLPRKPLQQPPNQIRLMEKPTKREQTEIKIIKKFISCYFDVVKKNINDLVPKTIITLFVNQSIAIAERELISNLYKEDMFDKLLEENSYMATMREDVKKGLILCRKCMKVINDIESRFRT